MAVGHVTVSRRGLLSGPLALGQAGLARHIHAVTTTFAEALAIARTTDLVATVPERLTCSMRADMQMRPLPFPMPVVPISQAWHPRFNADPGHKVLRERVHALAA